MALRTGTLLAGLLLALPSAGCGSADVFSLESLAQVAGVTREAGSARVELVTTVVSDDGTTRRTEESRGDGAFDHRTNRGVLTMSDPELGEVEFRFVDDVTYTRVPEAEAAGLPEGARWIRSEARGAAGAWSGQASPGSMLDYLRDSDAEPEEVGREHVRGVETTRYRAKLDFEQLFEEELAELPAAEQREAKAAFDEVLGMLEETVLPLEVWIDGDGLLRRMTLELRMQVPEPGGDPVRMELTQRVDFYAFGVDVDVEPPPEDEVVDASDLAAQPGG